MGRTSYFGFSTYGPGDKLSDDSFKILGADRDLMDLVLRIAAFGHHHDGASGALLAAAPLPPTLALDTTQGGLEGGRRFYYRMSLVSNLGLESAASTEVHIDTAAPVAEPGGAALTAVAGGTLLPGEFFYAVSAWRVANTSETKVGNLTNLTLMASLAPRSIRLTLPSLPAGADGFNIYRRSPGETTLYFLASIDMGIATPPTTYTDDGSVGEDCNRVIPASNRTATANAVTVSFPGATPSVPVGYTWKVYRTLVSGDYSNSLLHHVVEETSEGSGIITPVYLDTGYATQAAQPSAGGFELPSPTKVELGDAAEVQGKLPMGLLSGHLVTASFEYAGALSTITGDMPYPLFTEPSHLLGWSIAVDTAPTGGDLILDVNIDGATVFASPGDRPTLADGDGKVTTVLATPIPLTATPGKLTVDVDQPAGASNMVLILHIAVNFGSATTSEVYA